MRDLASLPMAHLHVHLEGSIRWATVAELAARNGANASIPRSPYPAPADFFRATSMVRDCLRTPEDFRRIAVEFCADEAAQGTRWAEVQFTAAAHAERLGLWRPGTALTPAAGEPLRAVLDGLDEGRDRYRVDCRVILDHPRRRPVERAWVTVELASAYTGRGVIGVGLAGDESHPAEPFAEVFAEARRRGLHIVHHAGESAGPDSIRAALAQGSARIGHGIRCLEDPSLVAELRERAVPLDVCPTSNLALGLVTAHPLPRLLDAGLTVTLNADTAPMVDTTLTREYALYPEHAIDLAASGVRASFAPEALRDSLLAEIESWGVRG